MGLRGGSLRRHPQRVRYRTVLLNLLSKTYRSCDGRSRVAAAAARAVKGRSGNDVGSLSLSSVGVDINVDAGVAVAVCTGERNELCSGRCEVASAGDLDLSALRVELL